MLIIIIIGAVVCLVFICVGIFGIYTVFFSSSEGKYGEGDELDKYLMQEETSILL